MTGRPNSSDAPPARPKRWRMLVLGFVAMLLLLEIGARVVGPRTRLDVDVLDTLLDDHRNQTNALAASGELTVAVVGSSTAGAGVDPDVLAMALNSDRPTGYVVWVPGANAAVLDVLTTEMLPGLATPATVVVAVTSRELNDNYDIGEFEVGLLPENLSSSLAWRRIARPDEFGTRLEAGFSDLSGLVRYRARLREPTSWVSWITSSDDGASWALTPSGRLAPYVASTEPLSVSEGHVERERRVLAKYSAGGGQTDALINALSDLERKGVDVLLVMLPTSHSTNHPLHPEGRDNVAAAQVAAGHAAAAAGVDFLDLTDFGTDDSWFSDSNHLNGLGSAQISSLIAEYLQQKP